MTKVECVENDVGDLLCTYMRANCNG